MIEKLMSRLFTTPLPLESPSPLPSQSTIRKLVAVLALLSTLEVLAFTVGSLFSTVACHLWIVLGLTSFGFLTLSYLRVLISDIKRFSFWGLAPLLASITVCYVHIKGYGALNTESLSELQFSLEQLQRSDLGYTQMFWVSYPSRSLLISLIPSLWMGFTPEAYRVGFSFPLMFGALYFYTALRTISERHPLSAPISGFVASSIFAFPMLVEFARTFEMATSSTYYGLWAIAATLIFAYRPSLASALTCAWTLGLLAASFTSGLALVALILFCLGVWLVRSIPRRRYDRIAMLSAIIVYSSIVTVALYLQQPRMLQPQSITFAQMWGKFVEALVIMVSHGKVGFLPPLLIIPLLATVLWTTTLRFGLLPCVASLWCLPVIWSAVNMQGKIAPHLPFCLYRALVIIPVVLYVFALALFRLTERWGSTKIWWRIALPLAVAGLTVYSKETYQRQRALEPVRPAWARESVIEQLSIILPEYKLFPGTDGILVNRVKDPSIETFLPCAQYLMYGWRRIPIQDEIPTVDASKPKPTVLVSDAASPALDQKILGLRKAIHPITVTRLDKPPLNLSVAIFLPNDQ